MARYLLLCLIGIWLMAAASSGPVRYDLEKHDAQAMSSGPVHSDSKKRDTLADMSSGSVHSDSKKRDTVADMSNGPVHSDSKKRDSPVSPQKVAVIAKEDDKTYTVNGRKLYRYDDVEMDEDEVNELFDKNNTTKRAAVPDPYLPDYPCQIEIYGNHNHNIHSADSLRERDVSEQTKNTLQELFEKNHSPSSALETIKTDMQISEGHNYAFAAADRADCPDLGYCFRSTSEAGRRTKRATIVKDKNKRWRRIALVPYEIVEEDFNDAQKRDILATFAFLETETCIAFRERTDNDVNYIKIADCGGGCWAHLGKSDGPYWQRVCLGDGCKWPGLYAHELGHTLGLQHEHQRPDRDHHIIVNEENIKNGSESSFEKFKFNSVLMTKYDFASAMHYERTSFGKPGTITITARKDWNNAKLGDVWWKMYSYRDVWLLNKEYGCDAFCKHVRCNHDSYVNKDCKCVTYEDYYATYCDNKYWNDSQCDGWASSGECEKNPGWMYFQCRKSCKACFNE